MGQEFFDPLHSPHSVPKRAVSKANDPSEVEDGMGSLSPAQWTSVSGLDVPTHRFASTHSCVDPYVLLVDILHPIRYE